MTEPLRVLTVVESLGLGGTERAAENFARAFAAHGHDSRVWAVSAGGPRLDRLQSAGVPVTLGSAIVTLVDGWQPDVVHLHSHGLSEHDVRQLARHCPDAIFVEQNVFSKPTPWGDLLSASFQLTDACLRRYLAHGPKASGARAFVVPNPVDVNDFGRDAEAGVRFRRLHGIPVDALLLGRVGQPITYKWSPLLVRSFERVAKADQGVWLLMVGAPPEAERQARRSRYASQIVSLPAGLQERELVAAYSAMDVFVHASGQGESFGYVLAEAMLAKVPVLTISTPWGDNSQGEVVGHGVGGLVAHDGREFAGYLDALCTDPDMRVDLGEGGRARVCAEFEAESVAQLAMGLAVHLAAATTPPPRTRSDGFVDGTSEMRDPGRYRARSAVAAFVLPKIANDSWRWLGPKALSSLARRLPRRGRRTSSSFRAE